MQHLPLMAMSSSDSDSGTIRFDLIADRCELSASGELVPNLNANPSC